MIWLNKHSIKEFEVKDGLKILLNLGIRDVELINQSPVSLVFKGLWNNSKKVFKVYNPDFDGTKSENEKLALKFARKLHITVNEGEWFNKGKINIGVFKFISPESFLDSFENAPIIESFIINFIKILRNKRSNNFGPLIGPRFFFFGRKLDYQEYLHKNFLFFLKKAQKKRLINSSERRSLFNRYNILLQRINKPKTFYFAHNDLSLKHLFWAKKNKRKIGVIDWESSMFLDENVDYSVWLVRNQDFYFSSEEGKSLTRSSISTLSVDPKFLKCHLFREGFIQEYYQRKENLKSFIEKYSFWIRKLGV